MSPHLIDTIATQAELTFRNEAPLEVFVVDSAETGGSLW